MTMGERPSGPVALCGFRLSISLAKPAVVIQMGGIHRSFSVPVRGMVEDPIGMDFLVLVNLHVHVHV